MELCRHDNMYTSVKIGPGNTHKPSCRVDILYIHGFTGNKPIVLYTVAKPLVKWIMT